VQRTGKLYKGNGQSRRGIQNSDRFWNSNLGRHKVLSLGISFELQSCSRVIRVLPLKWLKVASKFEILSSLVVHLNE
jgi:hypothetical protein